MNKLLNVVIAVLSVIAGILMIICITFIVKDATGNDDSEPGSQSVQSVNRPALIFSDSKQEEENSENTFTGVVEVPENVINPEPGPVSEVKALLLADQFANPKGTWILDYQCMEEVDGIPYHIISTTAGRTVYINAETGEILIATAKYGLQTLEEHFGQIYNHRLFTGSKGYEEGYMVFHKYMSAVIDQKDKKAAASLIDTSYFKETGSERNQKINDDTWKYYNRKFELIDWLNQGISKGELDSYELGYAVTLTDEYDDEYGDKWVDIYVKLKYYTKTGEGGYIDWESNSYTISVKQKGNNWVVARIW